MEKYKPMPMNVSPAMEMPMGPMAMNAPMPLAAPINAPMPYPVAPVNIHANFEAYNFFEPKKHHYHHGHHCKTGCSFTVILVLYILLVIILRSSWK